MKASLLLFFPLTATVSSQLILPNMQNLQRRTGRGFAGPALPPGQNQYPIMDPVGSGPGPAIPSDDKPSENPPSSSGPGSAIMLSDVMGRDRSINIFAGFTRDVESISNRLDNENQNSTVLAPLNSAIEKLPRKPWEDPKEYDSLGTDAYEGDDGMERANRNLRRFVEAHIVPTSPWKEGEKVRAVGSDRDVWWEERDGKKVVSSDSVGHQGANVMLTC